VLDLTPIDTDGSIDGIEAEHSPLLQEVVLKTVALYRKTGFVEPWISYLALLDARPVGICAFTGPPSDNRVELAYFTFPGFEGRGFATEMAAFLIARARTADPRVTIVAQTLAARGPSHRVLEKLGFVHVATLEDPEEGTVWEWRFAGGSAA